LPGCGRESSYAPLGTTLIASLSSSPSGGSLLKNKVGNRGMFFDYQIHAFEHHDLTTKTPQITIKRPPFFHPKIAKPL
jgi:hypothetical protein